MAGEKSYMLLGSYKAVNPWSLVRARAQFIMLEVALPSTGK